MKFTLVVVLAAALVCLPALAVPYSHVQSKPEVVAWPGTRFVSVSIHLRNLGDIATSCVVKASGQKRVTGLSAHGEADVAFDSLRSYHGYSISCSVN